MSTTIEQLPSTGDRRTGDIRYYGNIVDRAIARATLGESKLTSFHMAMEGMSSFKGRHMLNNLLTLRCLTRRPRYLEVGSWKGSTLCAATFSNDVEAVAIDNFSQFETTTFGRDRRHPRDSIMSSLGVNRAFSKPPFDAAVIDQDAFTVDLKSLGTPFDVYLYDGEHTYDAHYQAFTYFAPVLADVFIAVVDDYRNLPEDGTHVATHKALADLGYKIEKEVFLYDECDGTPEGKMKDGWWNGMWVAVVSKGVATPPMKDMDGSYDIGQL